MKTYKTPQKNFTLNLLDKVEHLQAALDDERRRRLDAETIAKDTQQKLNDALYDVRSLLVAKHHPLQ